MGESRWEEPRSGGGRRATGGKTCSQPPSNPMHSHCPLVLTTYHQWPPLCCVHIAQRERRQLRVQGLE